MFTRILIANRGEIALHIIRTARDERLFPGEGGIDVLGILGQLPQEIPFALEIPRVALTKAVGPDEVARLALLVTKSHLEPAEEGIARPPLRPAQNRVAVSAR